MTKTLTEQWREGTLDQRYYYVKYFGNCQKPFVEIELKNFLLDLVKVKDRDKIEVLAPVPSYDKVKEMSQKIERLEFDNEVLDMSYSQAKEIIIKLEKKLAIATKALEKYQEAINRFKKDPMNNIIMLAHQLIYDIDTDSKKALKEMEGVK